MSLRSSQARETSTAPALLEIRQSHIWIASINASTSEKITDADYEAAEKDLGCEVMVSFCKGINSNPH